MSRLESVVFCDGCGVEITVAPTIQGGKVYCCKDCADGFECNCAALLELDDERRDVSAAGGVDDLMV